MLYFSLNETKRTWLVKKEKKMKFTCIMLVVDDMDRSKKFYKDVFGFEVISDLVENVTLTGGFIALQTKSSWIKFIEKSDSDIKYRGNDFEIYFEEKNFDKFVKNLKSIDNIEYVHEFKEHDWGQRVVRFYDPDKHIIEVGEDMKMVCKRLFKNGYSIEAIVKKVGFPLELIESFVTKKSNRAK